MIKVFDDIGGKIKTLAKVLTVIGIAASIILGLVLISDVPWLGVGIIVFGSLFSWIGSFLLYGFGELIDNTAVIAGNTRKEKASALTKLAKASAPKNNTMQGKRTCPYCYETISTNDAVCSFCGKRL